jgi:glycosyltransferase involved in cell wall biosynthesis
MISSFISTLSVAFKDVDVVHIYGVGSSICIPLLRCVSRKTIISVDALDWKRAKWNRFASWYLRKAEKVAALFADSIVVDNKVVGQYYRNSYGVRARYVPYGADIRRDRRVDALKKFGLEEDDYLLFVGRLKPEKGVHRLIQAFEGLKTEKKLALVGDDAFSRDYIRQLKSIAGPNVKFLGYVYGEECRQLYCHAHLYVTASEIEGTSPALLTAMGYGNCVVVNDIPENRETIGSAGVTFRTDDVDDLRRQLQRLIDRPELVQAYRMKATERVAQHYSWEKVTDQLEHLYRVSASETRKECMKN